MDKKTRKEMEELVDAIKNAVPMKPTISRYTSNPPANYSTYTYNTPPTPNVRSIQIEAEDLEMCDLESIKHALEAAMDSLYPPFEPEIVHAMEKEYFLPALKVLVYRDGEYLSPQKEFVWKDMELEAECAIDYMRYTLIGSAKSPSRHTSPDENCDCGIYGSVNMEEVQAYLEEQEMIFMRAYAISASEPDPIVRRKLCIIEPNPGAKVIICRKGWKASGAFISEIIDETISVSDASNLLSIAWHREIDVRRIHENR